jgi:hypothetical protein
MKYIEDSKEIKDSLNDGRVIVSNIFAKFFLSLLVREINATPPFKIFVLFIFCIIFLFFNLRNFINFLKFFIYLILINIEISYMPIPVSDTITKGKT